MNESISILLLAVLYCVFSGVSPSSIAIAVWCFVGARFLYALCYYCNWQLYRSVSFGLSLCAIAALLVLGPLA